MPRKRKRNFIKCANCGEWFEIRPREIRPYCDACLYEDLMESLGLSKLPKRRSAED